MPNLENYIQLHFLDVSSAEQELIVARLALIGFDGFEEGNDFLKACIPESEYDESLLNDIVDLQQYKFNIEIIEPKNWNEEWEKSFEPVIVDQFCAIRASFHPPIQGIQHEIIITPKMSFGTGHHATTYQVIQLMQGVALHNKSVLDFGTGTGVLAILAEKLGAKEIFAIDSDEWSIHNAAENIKINACSRITLSQSDHIGENKQFDVILANINKHVILENLSSIAKQLAPGGVLIVSGILRNDQHDIVNSAFSKKLFVKTQSEKCDWIALSLTNVKPI
jgi:ribosomal protein L11 methyltransferase